MSGPTSQPPAPSAWADLLASALVGTARTGEQADPVLDAAATQALRRRAGLALVRDVAAPAPAPRADTPVVGPAAATRAEDLLAFDPASRHTTPVRDLAGRLELLAEWLEAAAAAGRRLPAELVPALVEAGRRHERLRPFIAPVAGPLAGWLAAQRPRWSYAAPTTSEPPTEETDPDVWELGSVAQRAAYLTRLRRREPARARALLEAAWAAEPPEHRAVLLAALATGLSTDDDPLLERALDDRRKQVREVALDLLGRLPGSGYAHRMAARARGCVQLPAGGRIRVRPPAGCDRSMRRDGIVARPPAGTGERAWWLEEILARTPLAVWPEPAVFLARGTEAEAWAATLHRGLARAAATQRDGGWAAALVGPLTADPAGHVEHVLAQCPRPWPPAVVDAVFAAIDGHLAGGRTGWRVTGLCELAALRLPADLAARAASLAARLRAERPNDPVQAVADRFAATLRYRHDMREELECDDD